MKLALISGLSGSGKSIALKAVEDLCYFCVDNLPLTLLPNLVNWYREQGQVNQIAISVDSRSHSSFDNFHYFVDILHKQGDELIVIFLETNKEVLLRRFSETHRKHPLINQSTTLIEAIKQERDILYPIKELAYVIDTSYLNPQGLRRKIQNFLQAPDRMFRINFESFGFKYGVPQDIDFVFDVRSLPNPYWQVELRELTGQDDQIQKYFMEFPIVAEMIDDLKQFLQKVVHISVNSSKNYLTIGIGCTGGQHRSVYIVEQLSLYFESQYTVHKYHRELMKKSQL